MVLGSPGPLPGILVVHFWLEDIMLLGFYGTEYLPGPLPWYSRTPGTHMAVLRVAMAISGNAVGCMLWCWKEIWGQVPNPSLSPKH